MALYEAGGRHLRTNRAYQRMLGYAEGELETLQVGPLTCPEDFPEGERYHQELLAGKRDHYFWEHRFQRKDGCLVWAKSGAYAVRGPRGRLRFIVSIVEDVTDRHAAEGRIRQLASIVDSAHDAIIGMTLDGTIVSWNRAAELLYGYALNEILGKPISKLGLPGQADDPLHMIQGFGSEGGIEAVHRRKNGDPVEVSLAVSPISDGSGKACGVSVIARDRTESKRLERELLEISGSERRRIGHELHDGVGQHLTGTAFKAKLLEQILSEEAPQYAPSGGELVGLMNTGIDQVRRLARGLDPIEVEADGLDSALSQWAENTRTIFRMSCSFQCLEPVSRFDPTVSLQLYRIAQESIHNAVKHGRAKRIEIYLGFSDSRIRLVIADDGGGFNSEASTRGGMGLRIMEYRIHAIGGSLMIDSQVNQGTRITCLVPVFQPPGQQLDSVPPLASHPLVTPAHRQDRE
jgi:PAS domain S-box-containing protein